ncbi:MAG: hypothetical protein ABJ007_10135 [Pseudophaeobacter sp.]|uniref:hypothetical protein n=1 Tax=Pseudophaeobacter sp. TaxID=1971739 RepID=UPI0032969C02
MDSTISILDGSVKIPMSYFEEKSHVSDGDTVVVSGTLIEGIGNSHSDLDGLVLCNQRPKIATIASDAHVSMSDEAYNPNAADAELHNTYDFYGDSGIHVDFDYILFSEVERLISKINETFEDLITDQRILYEPIMKTKEDRFIHRLFIAVPVVNSDTFTSLRARIPFDRFRYVSARELQANFYYYQDVQGTWMADEWRMAQETARELLVTQLRAFLQMAGLTNKHRKWLYTCVTQVPGNDGAFVRRCADHLLRLGQDKDAAYAFIVTAMEMLDELFRRGVQYQEQTPGFPSPQDCVAQLETEFSKRNQNDHALAREEFEFRLKALHPQGTRSLKDMLFC